MNTAVTRLYALLVALTLTGLVAWAVTDWYQLQQKAELSAAQTLRQSAGHVTDWTIHDSGRNPAVLSAILRQDLASDPRWKMVLLSSPENGTEYYRGPRSQGDLNRAVPQWSARFPREIKAEVPVFPPSGRPWTLVAVYEFYGTADVLNLLKASGLTLLVLVLLTAALVLWQAGRPTARPQPAPVAAPPSHSPAYAEPFEEGLSSQVEGDDEYWFDDNLSLEDLPPLATEGLNPEPEDDVGEGPSLLAPSGLGWAHFLNDRLTWQLDRCAGDNQDLALIMLSGRDLDSASLYQALAQEVRAYFPSHDLDFEVREDHKEPSIAIVLPNRSLEEALGEAQSLMARTDRILPQIRLCAGVASRSGRLLGATTLITEATSALSRARSSSTRVVGLKTDPDKYREHLARSGPEQKLA